jgi:hypothetical protein
MARAFRRSLLVLFVAGLAAAPLFADDAQKGGFGIGMGLGVGVQSFNEGGVSVPYSYLALTPDFSIGKFGIGLALVINYKPGADGNLAIRQADWVPANFQNFFEIYLPKLMYVRWGEKGDPLFVKAGSMDDMSLGNGFIVGNYSNVLFLPATRIFGLAFDLDGALFGFPFVGMESFVGNLAALDVMGARLYVRPLVGTDLPVLKNLEAGVTFAADTRPDVSPLAYSTVTTTSPAAMALGGDIRLPLVYNPVVSLAVFGDVASILTNSSLGGELGLGGRFFGFLTYGVQARLMGPGFVPTYFGGTYDAIKATTPTQTGLYDALTASGGATTFGWLASTGTSFLDDKIVFNISLDAPFFAPYPGALAGTAEYNLNLPHLRGIFLIADGIIPGISFNVVYDKSGISTWSDFVNLTSALVQATLSYTTGPATIAFVYKAAPGEPPTSGLQSQIKLF